MGLLYIVFTLPSGPALPSDLLTYLLSYLLTYLLIALNVHSNLLRLIRDWGEWRDGYLCPTTYSLHCHHQNDAA